MIKTTIKETIEKEVNLSHVIIEGWVLNNKGDDIPKELLIGFNTFHIDIDFDKGKIILPDNTTLKEGILYLNFEITECQYRVYDTNGEVVKQYSSRIVPGLLNPNYRDTKENRVSIELGTFEDITCLEEISEENILDLVE